MGVYGAINDIINVPRYFLLPKKKGRTLCKGSPL